MLLENFLILIASLVFLVRASNYFVESSARLARLMGISEFIIGFTLVAIGTSMPELVNSIAASMYHDSSFIMGNIIGSNIANIGLIIGIAIIIGKQVRIKKWAFGKEGLFLIIAYALLALFVLNRTISPVEGMIFLLIYFGYALYVVRVNLFKMAFKDIFEQLFRRNKPVKNIPTPSLKIKPLAYNFAVVVASVVVLYFSAKFLIPSAENIAIYFNIPSSVIAITIVALGTTLPEMSVSISAARKGRPDMIAGTILGSNIANIMLILGVSSIINPLVISNLAMRYYIPGMIFMMFLLMFLIRKYSPLRRTQGIILLSAYALFIAITFIVA